MRLDAGAQNGTSQAKTKRIFNISIRLYESIGVEVGPDLNNMEAIPFRSSANPMDQAIRPIISFLVKLFDFFESSLDFGIT